MSVVSANKFYKVAIVVVVIVLFALLVSIFLQNTDSLATANVGKLEVETTDVDTVETISDTAVIPSDINLSSSSDINSEFDQLVIELVAELHEEFGDQIKSIALQVSLIELLNDLIVTYPERGKALFERIIRTAFPELADNILKAVATMGLYDMWLLDIMPELNKMGLIEQESILWSKRYELFSNEAAEIWTEQWTPEQEREASVQKTLSLLDTAYDTPLNERLYLLQSSFEESYGNTIEGYVFDAKSVMSQAFLHFDSVQQDLSAMPQEERQTKIAGIRRELGFPEDRIAILSERDLKRELDWKNGYAYMEKKAQAEQSFAGEALEAELDGLRERYFSYRAATIKKEEGREFFRYARPRVYGQN